MSLKLKEGRFVTSSSSLSRERAQGRYSKKRKVRKRKSVTKIVLTTVAASFAAAVLGLGVFLFGIQALLGQGLDTNLFGVLTDSSIHQPFYMLLLGTDKSNERAQSADFGESDSAYRTDSMILARLDPPEKKVTLISIERDTLVDLGKYGKQKINAAYSIGGAAMAVKEVSKLAGVPIAHYAEINFDEFVSVVDTIGGIDVNIKVDLKDNYANLHIQKGEQTLDGTTALALCRARHAYEAYGAGDYYRASNQRMILGAIVKKVLASNPFTLAGSVTTLAKSVTTDLDVSEILALAYSYQGFDPATDLYSGLEPTTSKYINGGWYDIVDEKAWKNMMQRVNAGLSPYKDASEDFTLNVAGADSAYSNPGE